MVVVGWTWWGVTVALLATHCVTAAVQESVEPLEKTQEQDDYLIKQVIWKKCHRKMSAACLKLSLMRTVETMSKDSSLVLAPGVFFSSNLTEAAVPADLARGLSQDHAPLDDLVNFAVGRYVRSLTLNVNLADFFTGGNDTLQNSVKDAFSGRGKGGFGGYGGIVLVLGGSLASMMLAGLAALAGKALMTSMLALMMSALAAMKGGGGGGGEHKTYEVITKPIVSHVNTHSSEVQHEHGGHHHYRRSLKKGVVADELVDPYTGYGGERQKMEVQDQWGVPEERHQRVVGSQEWMIPDERKEEPFLPIGMTDQRMGRSVSPKDVGEEETDDPKKAQEDGNQRNKRSLDGNIRQLTKNEIIEINRAFQGDSHRYRRDVNKDNDQEKDSSEVYYSYAKPLKENFGENKKIFKESLQINDKVPNKEKRSADETIKRPDRITQTRIHQPHGNVYEENAQKLVRLRRNPEEVLQSYSTENVNDEAIMNQNYHKQPFKYLPSSQHFRIKRSVEVANPPDSRIYHIYQNPYETRFNQPNYREQVFTMGGQRYKRHMESSLIMPLALLG